MFRKKNKNHYKAWKKAQHFTPKPVGSGYEKISMSTAWKLQKEQFQKKHSKFKPDS